MPCLTTFCPDERADAKRSSGLEIRLNLCDCGQMPARRAEAGRQQRVNRRASIIWLVYLASTALSILAATFVPGPHAIVIVVGVSAWWSGWYGRRVYCDHRNARRARVRQHPSDM